MKKTLALLVAAALFVLPSSTPAFGAVPKPSVCGPLLHSGPLTEPPKVETNALPRDASGDRELIMAVHRDGDRFCYTYTLNGEAQTKSPVLLVHRGERFALRIVNDIGAPSPGERVASTAIPACKPAAMPMDAPVVHYSGYLNRTIEDRYMHARPGDTNIHLHGFEGPASQENIFLSTLSTPMHACEYRIAIPATQPAGTYFYHPHAHGVSEAEMSGGLTGAWIVEPDTPQIAPQDDRVLILRYRLPAENDNMFAPDTSPIYGVAAARLGHLPLAKPVSYNPFTPPPWPLAFPVSAGAFRMPKGSCNGLMSEAAIAVDGVDTPAALPVPAGRPQLLRIVNATSDSPKKLELLDGSGKVVPMHVVEIDGVPISGDSAHPLAAYESMRSLMVPSSGRAAILLSVRQGETVRLTSAHFCEGIDAFYEMPHDLVRISGISSADPPGPAVVSHAVQENPAAQTLIAYVRAHRAQVRRRAITFSEYVMPKHDKIPAHSAFFITDTTNSNFHEHQFWPMYRKGSSVPDNPDIVVKRGSIEEWYVFNTTMESHVFHVHQMAYVEERGPNAKPAMADTSFIPVGTLLPNPRDPAYPLVKPSVTRLLLDFRHVPRGTFVVHCHMLFHEDRGMMAIVRVE